MHDHLLTHCRMLVDGELRADGWLAIRDTKIAAVGDAKDEAPAARECTDLEGRLLLPGFVDTQVNGGGGVLFNHTPTVASIERIGLAHRRFGTTGFLPTLISDEFDVIAAGVEAVEAAIDGGTAGVLGIHIEGPFLNHGRRGVHDEKRLRRLTDQVIHKLRPLTNGRTLLTLAPEAVDPQLITALCDQGIIVSIGHSDATYEQARAALDQGASGFTHLFNAMSQLNNRAPGVVGAALDDPESYCGLIVDGHHVSDVALRIALRCKPRDRIMLVSDAMPSVGSTSSGFDLHGRSVRMRDGVLTDLEGRLAGAHLDMASAVRNVMAQAGVPLAEAVAMASSNPAAFLGLSDTTGRIATGLRADLVVAGDDLDVQQTWIAGQLCYSA